MTPLAGSAPAPPAAITRACLLGHRHAAPACSATGTRLLPARPPARGSCPLGHRHAAPAYSATSTRVRQRALLPTRAWTAAASVSTPACLSGYTASAPFRPATWRPDADHQPAHTAVRLTVSLRVGVFGTPIRPSVSCASSAHDARLQSPRSRTASPADVTEASAGRPRHSRPPIGRTATVARLADVSRDVLSRRPAPANTRCASTNRCRPRSTAVQDRAPSTDGRRPESGASAEAQRRRE